MALKTLSISAFEGGKINADLAHLKSALHELLPETSLNCFISFPKSSVFVLCFNSIKFIFVSWNSAYAMLLSEAPSYFIS